MCLLDLFKRLGLFKLIFIDIDFKVGYNEKNCSFELSIIILLSLDTPRVLWFRTIVQDGDNLTP